MAGSLVLDKQARVSARWGALEDFEPVVPDFGVPNEVLFGDQRP